MAVMKLLVFVMAGYRKINQPFCLPMASFPYYYYFLTVLPTDLENGYRY